MDRTNQKLSVEKRPETEKAADLWSSIGSKIKVK